MINEQLQNLSYKSTDGTNILKLSDVQTLLADYSCWLIGKTRHPYADVLHQWIEGSSMETQYVGQTEWVDLPFSFETKYRIKEFEPEYEYLWMDLRTPDDYGLPRNAYMTQKVANAYFYHSSTYFKIEQTKRVRIESAGGSETK